MRFRQRLALVLALAYFHITLFMSLAVGGHFLNHPGHPPDPAASHAAGHTTDHATQHPASICVLMCAVSTGLPAIDPPLNAAPHLSSEPLFALQAVDEHRIVFALLYARPPPVSSNA